MEIYLGIKDTKWSRAYTAMLLSRRLLMVILIIFFRFMPRILIFLPLIILQLGYFILFLLIRPYKEKAVNIMEIVNESFNCVYVFILLPITDADSWDPNMIQIFILLMTINSV